LVGLFAQQAQQARRGLLQERQRSAIQDAVLAARGGDFVAAENAVDEAEKLQASPGEVRMLRGQLAIYQYRFPDAIRHLKQAVEVMPQSVAAGSLLGFAYLKAGLFAAMDRLLVQLDQMSPATTEDYLFSGQLQAELDPGRALQTLDEALKRRPDSVLALLV